MTRDEQATRLELIDPALAAAGWTSDLIDPEYRYTPGRIRLLGETTVRDDPQYIDYVLRSAPRGSILAVVEAKDESHHAGAGMQQALSYATDIQVPFAYSTNGTGIVEQDLRSGDSRQLTEFPSPADLLARYMADAPGNGPEVTNRRGDQCRNPIIEPASGGASALAVRYYQERAVTAAISEIVKGRSRCLLTLATGTGKTFIAFTVAHKLMQSGYAEKILFLADRVTLRNQAYNDFWGFGDQRAVVTTGGALPLERNVHFAIYQGLYAELPDGRRVYEDYPADYFDVIIVDECHRSGYGDWSAILEYFGSAFHLGMTATPKRSDSIDTYATFGREQPDADGHPAAVYEYSLGRGMDDGFLATYKVLQVETNIDADGLHIRDEVERGAELIVPEGETALDVYGMSAFERDITVPDRTRVLCEHLAGVLRRTGVRGKTIVFCVTQEHAALVRQKMQALLGSETGLNLYAARIVSEERDGPATLEQFQESTSEEPVLVTTVDLLTTGVNAPAVRNIVFMKTVSSPTVFKQIIGRGSRVDETTSKTFFRIIDYTNATRLIDAWDTPSAPPVDGPTTGDEVLFGTVTNAQTGDPVAASITVRLQRRLIAEVACQPDGTFNIPGLPAATIDVYVSAPGYTRRSLRRNSTEAQPLLVDLHQPAGGGDRMSIHGVSVRIGTEVQVDLGDGRDISSEEYLDRARESILAQVADINELHTTWTSVDGRSALQAHLSARQVNPELLELVLLRADADYYDLLSHVAFGTEIPTRDQRATAARPTLTQTYPNLDDGLLDALLDHYRLAGIDEVSTAEVFHLPPFSTVHGGVSAVMRTVGGAAAVRALLSDLATALYTTEFDG